jgi:catechol 2,3-dioxygenase-like lactoylglutathione lyase family enzyme
MKCLQSKRKPHTHGLEFQTWGFKPNLSFAAADGKSGLRISKDGWQRIEKACGHPIAASVRQFLRRPELRLTRFGPADNLESWRQHSLSDVEVKEAAAMSNMTTVEVKAFVPARDFAQSKRFYQDLGFELAWSSEDLAYIRHGNSSFLLQNFYQKEHADNFMMHLLVEDVEAWWSYVLDHGLAAKYGVRVESPADRPWGMRDFVIIDPTGVLWRIGQNIENPGS